MCCWRMVDMLSHDSCRQTESFFSRLKSVIRHEEESGERNGRSPVKKHKDFHAFEF